MVARKLARALAFLTYTWTVACRDIDYTGHTDLKTNPDNVFNGVYTECFLHLSYSCLQKKTLLYLKELNNLSEVSVIGDYVKFVKINTTDKLEYDDVSSGNTDELSFMIDKAVDDFFNNHILKFNALGRDISLPRNMDEFVGRKKRKGGGGGGHGGHDDGGKKKMMMMAMMCMKMKLMMMVPAMMGMMGMMSFKGMMFSMMSFMLSKMMLLMKILEKKGGVGGIGGGGGDGGWAAGGGGGGAWMPAGGQDFGGGGGGYDANGQWQSRSIVEEENFKPLNINEQKQLMNYDIAGDVNKENTKTFKVKTADYSNYYSNDPEISYVKPVVRYNNHIDNEIVKLPVLVYKKSNVDTTHYGNEPHFGNKDEHNIIKIRSKRNLDTKYVKNINHYEKSYTDDDNRIENEININGITVDEHKSRKKRGILDILQNSYMYWMNTLLGTNNNRRTNFQRYKIINGIRYVYYPLRPQKSKMPKEIQLTSAVKVSDDFKPIITAEDFNKGEIMEGAVESRMNKKKFNKIKDTVNDTVDDNPWE